MKIAIASDHAGYKYKEEIKKYLQSKNIEVVDFGTDSEESCDYPDFVFPAAGAVANGECDKGIVLGGSGNGEAMAANKVKGIRCAVCWNKDSAKLASLHNNANMISIGQRMMDLKSALDIVDAWLNTPFEGGRHIARIKKLENIIT
jgi:ribose 5-phosphate isomerase B